VRTYYQTSARTGVSFGCFTTLAIYAVVGTFVAAVAALGLAVFLFAAVVVGCIFGWHLTKGVYETIRDQYDSELTGALVVAALLAVTVALVALVAA